MAEPETPESAGRDLDKRIDRAVAGLRGAADYVDRLELAGSLLCEIVQAIDAAGDTYAPSCDCPQCVALSALLDEARGLIRAEAGEETPVEEGVQAGAPKAERRGEEGARKDAPEE